MYTLLLTSSYNSVRLPLAPSLTVRLFKKSQPLNIPDDIRVALPCTLIIHSVFLFYGVLISRFIYRS